MGPVPGIGEAILEALRNQPLTQSRKIKARERAAAWSIDAMVKGYTSLYNEIGAASGATTTHREDSSGSTHRQSRKI
jgi:hypothetical protein